jgi:hypothetical protein
MRFLYSQATVVPEMTLPVVVTGVAPFPLLDVEAKIDTGADTSVIPEGLLETLGLQPEGFVTLRGALGEKWQRRAIYRLRVRVGGEEWMPAKVVASTKTYMLVGRELLNRFVLTANGPAGWFDLTIPARE